MYQEEWSKGGWSGQAWAGVLFLCLMFYVFFFDPDIRVLPPLSFSLYLSICLPTTAFEL